MKNYFNFFVISILVLTAIFLAGCFEDEPNTSGAIFGGEAPSMAPRLVDGSTFSNSVEVVRNVATAVVGINSNTATYSSVGSGVAIAEGGYLLTNSHVIVNPNSIELHLADGTSTTASLIWEDKALDLAVLKSKKDLPYLKIADDAEVRVGEAVLAIGTPFQLQFKHSVTKGIVSALNRTVRVDTEVGQSYLQSLIQHDASINPGNSGGPLINGVGEVIGINTVKIEAGEGIGFAIPASTTKNVLRNVLKEGQFTSAYLGVFGYDASIPYYYKKTNANSGYYLLGVKEGSPAHRAGLKAKDVILKINNKNVNSAHEFKKYFLGLKQGERVSIEYMSEGTKKTIELLLDGKKPLEKTK